MYKKLILLGLFGLVFSCSKKEEVFARDREELKAEEEIKRTGHYRTICFPKSYERDSLVKQK